MKHEMRGVLIRLLEPVFAGYSYAQLHTPEVKPFNLLHNFVPINFRCMASLILVFDLKTCDRKVYFER